MTIAEIFERKFEDTFTVTDYNRYERWVGGHIARLRNGYFDESNNELTFDWLKIGCTLYFKSDYGVIKAKLKGVIVATDFIGLETDMGNIWYFEARKTKKEAEAVVLNDN